MALLQIAEPGGKSPQPQRKRAVGIDLGTTNSLVATRCGVAVETLPDEQGRHLLPSVVRFRDDGSVQVGAEAKAASIEDPAHTVISVKRLLGKGLADIQRDNPHLPYGFTGKSDAPAILTPAGPRSPLQISAEILKLLARRAEKFLAGPLDGAVITVPAYFNDAQRQQTRDAARLAGLSVLRLLNEPTAAAVAYGLDSRDEGNVVVYDLGGGTFDVSVLSLRQGVFQVLATGGDTALGGDDFDHRLAEWIIAQAGHDSRPDSAGRNALLQEANRVRHALSEVERVTVQWQGWQGQLDQALLAEICKPLIDKTLLTCRRVLRDARLTPADIDNVVLVGGATRMPVIRHQVQGLFQREPLVGIDPDKVVAIGAGIQADVLAGNKSADSFLLLDVNPLSLGIETMGELVEKIIPRNTTIPVARAQEFTTFKDGQTAMSFHVVQGERELVSECRSLARFELRGIPPMVAGAAKVKVTFQVDADGLLSVSATELSTGTTAEIQVKPSYGLHHEEIEAMLRASHDHAEADMRTRALREARLEAQQLLDALAAAMDADGNLLQPAEREHLAAVAAGLAEAVAGEDTRRIHEATEKLNHSSEQFAARRMDQQIRKALRGASINQIDSPVDHRSES
ncbi:MAG: molecular chaperone HscA [Pseudomonadota bacterium]|jgi:molecular chaperone HscA